MLVSLSLLLPGSGLVFAAPVLIKVIDQDGKATTGELLSENDATLEIVDLSSGQHRMLKKVNVASVRKDISESEAIESAGLSNLIAWKVQRSLGLGIYGGKVALVEGETLYASLGHGATRRQ